MLQKLKEIKLISGDYLFVEVPDDAYDFKVSELHDNRTCLEYNSIKEDTAYISKYNGFFELISTTKDITEEQATLIAETGVKTIKGTPNFDPEYARDSYQEMFLGYAVDKYNKLTKLPVHTSAKRSLQSLIQANGLDVNKNYLILRKINL